MNIWKYDCVHVIIRPYLSKVCTKPSTALVSLMWTLASLKPYHFHITRRKQIWFHFFLVYQSVALKYVEFHLLCIVLKNTSQILSWTPTTKEVISISICQQLCYIVHNHSGVPQTTDNWGFTVPINPVWPTLVCCLKVEQNFSIPYQINLHRMGR